MIIIDADPCPRRTWEMAPDRIALLWALTYFLYRSQFALAECSLSVWLIYRGSRQMVREGTYRSHLRAAAVLTASSLVGIGLAIAICEAISAVW